MECISGAFAGSRAALNQKDGQWFLRSSDETLALEPTLSFDLEAVERVPSPVLIVVCVLLMLFSLFLQDDVAWLRSSLFLIATLLLVHALRAEGRWYVAIRSNDRFVVRARIQALELRELGRATATVVRS